MIYTFASLVWIFRIRIILYTYTHNIIIHAVVGMWWHGNNGASTIEVSVFIIIIIIVILSYTYRVPYIIIIPLGI